MVLVIYLLFCLITDIFTILLHFLQIVSILQKLLTPTLIPRIFSFLEKGVFSEKNLNQTLKADHEPWLVFSAQQWTQLLFEALKIAIANSENLSTFSNEIGITAGSQRSDCEQQKKCITSQWIDVWSSLMKYLGTSIKNMKIINDENRRTLVSVIEQICSELDIIMSMTSSGLACVYCKAIIYRRCKHYCITELVAKAVHAVIRHMPSWLLVAAPAKPLRLLTRDNGSGEEDQPTDECFATLIMKMACSMFVFPDSKEVIGTFKSLTAAQWHQGFQYGNEPHKPWPHSPTRFSMSMSFTRTDLLQLQELIFKVECSYT